MLRTLSLKDLVGGLDLPISFEVFLEITYRSIERYGLTTATPSKMLWQEGQLFRGNEDRKIGLNLGTQLVIPDQVASSLKK